MAMKNLMRLASRGRMPVRLMSTANQEKPLNMIQQMKEYQEALQLAVDKRYAESLEKLNESMKVVEKATGTPFTVFHLFLYQRIASIQQIIGDGP